MSAINDALSKLAEQQFEQQNSDKTTFSRAQIDMPKSRPSRLVWAVVGFTISLGIGAWAVTSGTEQNDSEQNYFKTNGRANSVASNSNVNRINEVASNNVEKIDGRIADTTSPVTTRVTEPDAIPIYSNEPVDIKPQPSQTKTSQSSRTSNNSKAATKSQTRSKSTPSSKGSIKVEQVQLSNYQLAEQSISVAEKALDDGNLEQAISAYEKALRYTPKDENTRRKLAALYYGSKRSQQAGRVLEAGIKQNPNSSSLRLAYADIFRKEQQLDAALSVLMYLPANASIEYLATRAALAQQLKQQETAYTTYKVLTQREPNNARWWLGYAMQQESYNQYNDAKLSYEKSLSLVGLSSQSQAYARSRIDFIDLVTKGDKE